MKPLQNFLTISFVLVLTLFSCQKKEKNNELIELKPFRGPIGIELKITGSVQPRNRLEIKPQLSGRIEEILVVEGQEVKKGQIIAWMSSTDRAALLDIIRTQNKDTSVNWEEVYKPTPIISPIDGFVILRNKEPGQTVSLNDIIFVIADKLIILANVDETDLRYVKVGQKVKISLDAYPDVSFIGIVEHISYEAQEISNVTMYQTKILPLKSPKFLRSGMTATITVEAEKKEDALLLPSDAIIKRNKKSFVLVKDFDSRNGRKLQEVETGIDTGQKVEIISGLSDDDIVLIANPGKVSSERRGMMPGIPGLTRQRQQR